MRIAQHRRHERIGVEDFLGVGVDEQNSVMRRFKQATVAYFGHQHLHLVQLALRHVTDDCERAGGLAQLVAQHCDGRFDI